jgi:Lipopolysaccharide-assembly
VKNSTTAALACLGLSGCLGYHIGPAKPYYLRDIHTIAIPTFTNKTLIPRVEVLVTDTVIKQFQQDGTYRIASGESADATLKGEIIRISRSPAMGNRSGLPAKSSARPAFLSAPMSQRTNGRRCHWPRKSWPTGWSHS